MDDYDEIDLEDYDSDGCPLPLAMRKKRKRSALDNPATARRTWASSSTTPRESADEDSYELSLEDFDSDGCPLPSAMRRKRARPTFDSPAVAKPSRASSSTTPRKRVKEDPHEISLGKFDENGLPSRSAKKRKKEAPQVTEEKRAKRFRARPPQSYLTTLDRALTQRMFVLDRARGGTEEWPEEVVQMAGTTGNVYEIRIGKIPSCTCPDALKGNQCKHIIYVLVRVLKAPPHLQYQLAFLSSELRSIFAQAPPIPSAQPSPSSSPDGQATNRKPIEGDCPICVTEFEPATGGEEIVYCKAACGNNVHKLCFEQWAATKKKSGAVTCPFCRTPWVGDEDMVKRIARTGKANEEGYVNVAAELGLSGVRDYSSYHPFWVRRQVRAGLIDL